MNETTKTLRLWGDFERSLLHGRGIDIGCGPDPVAPDVRRFDVEDGDANEIGRYVTEQFDYVYSSHCLEHMQDPAWALRGWWSLVRPGGHLIVIVPDEDLYEQGVFPSRFNHGHTVTFTIGKSRSWSPASINVLALASALPGGLVISVALQDQGYDRRLYRFGPDSKNPLARLVRRVNRTIKRWMNVRFNGVDRFMIRWFAVDQTSCRDAMAQIQIIVRNETGQKLEPAPSALRHDGN